MRRDGEIKNAEKNLKQDQKDIEKMKEIEEQINSESQETPLEGDNNKEEVDDAKDAFKRYKWPTIDITRKSVEETAASIIKIHQIFLRNKK